ncbi:Mitochondrial fission protein [Mortierella antarctica]|nr:Mitochondrial fission protein [Mortierella antarctica]
MEFLHAFDASEFASSARSSLSTTRGIVFSPLTAQAVKGDFRGIATITGLSGMAPHLMATQYLRRATASAQALALTGVRQATLLTADQMLTEDIPEPVARVSLFQGYKAAYPERHLHGRHGKRDKSHHPRRRKHGYGDEAEDPSTVFSSLLSEREHTIKEQVNLQAQKANLTYKLSKLSEREDELADTLADLNERLASVSEGLRAHSGKALQLGYRDEATDTGTCIQTLQGHDGVVTCLDLNGPYGTLVTASKDNTTRVWDLATFKCLGKLPDQRENVECMQLQQDILVTGYRHHEIRVWNLANLSHSLAARSASPAPSGASRTVDKATEAMPDEPEGSPRPPTEIVGVLDNCWTSTLSGHAGPVSCLYFEGQTLLSGSNDKTIKEWDMSTGQCVLTMDLLWAMGTAQSWSHWMELEVRDHSFVGSLQFWQYALCSGTIDGVLRMWDLRTGQSHRTLVGHTGPVTSLQFDEYHVVSGSTDKSVRIWDLRTGGVQDIQQYEEPVNSLRFDAAKIVVGSGVTLKVYDRVAQRHSYYAGHTSAVESVRFNDSVIASGGQDSTVRLWSC